MTKSRKVRISNNNNDNKRQGGTEHRPDREVRCGMMRNDAYFDSIQFLF